jgi:hypothetical protein
LHWGPGATCTLVITFVIWAYGRFRLCRQHLSQNSPTNTKKRRLNLGNAKNCAEHHKITLVLIVPCKIYLMFIKVIIQCKIL